MIAIIPRGYIAVSNAFGAYFEKRFGYQPGNTFNDLGTNEYHTASNEMLEFLSSGQLEAFIWYDGIVASLAKHGWNDISAHHVFASRTIESEWDKGCAWEGFRGKTPFVDVSKFEALLSNISHAPSTTEKTIFLGEAIAFLASGFDNTKTSEQIAIRWDSASRSLFDAIADNEAEAAVEGYRSDDHVYKPLPHGIW